MLDLIVRTLVIAAHLHAIRPDAPLDRIIGATYAAVLEETPHVPAEILVAIAEHESDLDPRAVSYQTPAGRVDVHWDGQASIGKPSACGLVQSIAHARWDCANLMDRRYAMSRGVAEIEGWLVGCRSMRCALAGYAYGVRGVMAWRMGRLTWPNFADLFLRRAAALGWSPYQSVRVTRIDGDLGRAWVNGNYITRKAK